MRKTFANLDEEERDILLYLADLGTALCLSGLVVGILQFAGSLFDAL